MAPGTAASVVGLVIVWGLSQLSFFIPSFLSMGIYVALFAVITVVGTIAAGVTEKASGKKDPGFIVIDEVAGMMVAFFMMPLDASVMICGLLLFRAFDMFKIPPADKFEKMGGGLGIMTDDLMAGLYTNIVLQVAIRLAIRM